MIDLKVAALLSLSRYLSLLVTKLKQYCPSIFKNASSHSLMNDMENAMAYAKNTVSLVHEGQKYSAAYTVDSGVISVIMKDYDGMDRATSTYVDGSTIDSVARSLLRELLRDIGLL